MVYFAVVASIGVVYLATKTRNCTQAEPESSQVFIRRFWGQGTAVCYSKSPPWGSLFCDQNREMGLDRAIEILGPPRTKREVLTSYRFRAKRGTAPLRASPRL